MQRYKGQMQIIFVLPDYYEELPKACYGGWGRYYIVVSPDGRALPCHGATHIPSLELRRACGTTPSTGSGTSRRRSRPSAATRG